MMRSAKSLGALVVVGGLVACAGEPASEDEASSGRVFVETLGNDTIAIESFSRTDSTIEGQVVSRNPVTTLARYRAELDGEGRIERFEASWHPGEALEGPAAGHVVATREDGAVRIVRQRVEGTDTVVVEPEALLVPNVGRLPLAMGLIDHATRHAVAAGVETLDIAMLSPQSGRLAPNALTSRGGGVFSLDYFGSPQLVTVDEVGAVRSLSGRETTNRVEVAPSGALDLMALAADYAARDARGAGLGVPSPTDTVTATVRGAEIEVIYSRPAVRGREIWGGLVPYDEVWRTGANAATHFTTSRALRLRDLDVPAGTYTLWSTFTADGGTLIVNSQTGQWGTAYDAEQDFGRVELEPRPLEESVERFTIEIADAGDGPRLRLAWADREYVAPIEVR